MTLRHHERGAAMVFGLFFAVFLVAVVYTIVGTSDAVLYRERMQDAADSAALSAAVVNARGMNLIALINMTMAAVLAILVALRLAETLCYVAIAVCTALSTVTWGASMSIVPTVSQTAQQLNGTVKSLKPTVNEVLAVLHTAGKAVSVAVPLGSNLSVIDRTAAYYGALGVAIPSRLTLPVQDDTFPVLCDHAGELVGTIALVPLSPVLPGSIEKRVSSALGKLVAAGSDWFCGKGGKRPDLSEDKEDRLVELPRTSAQRRCDELAPRGPDDTLTKGQKSELEEVCTRAAVESLASMPDRDGQCRNGEPLCPTGCGKSNRRECPPPGFEDCEPELARTVEAAAPSFLGGSSLVSCVDGSPYHERLGLARDQCRPASAGGREDLVGLWWMERKVTRRFAWHPLRKAWVEDPTGFSAQPERLVTGDADDDAFPCGEDGAIGEEFERDASKPVCEGLRSCVTQLGHDVLGQPVACPRGTPRSFDPKSFVEESTEVTQIVRCAYETEQAAVEAPEIDMNKEMNEGKDKKQNTNPFRLEKQVYLGGSDFQLRTVVVGPEVPKAAHGLVALARWGKAESEESQDATTDQTAAGLASLGRIALGQAEYYFDWRGIDSSLGNQLDDEDVTEWMWNMGWRARLRPFRLNHRAADGEREKQPGKLDSDQTAYAPSGADSMPLDELDCGKLGDSCDEAQQVIDVFGDGDEEEE